MTLHNECPKCQSDNFTTVQKTSNNGTVLEYECKVCNWKYSKKLPRSPHSWGGALVKKHRRKY